MEEKRKARYDFFRLVPYVKQLNYLIKTLKEVDETTYIKIRFSSDKGEHRVRFIIDSRTVSIIAVGEGVRRAEAYAKAARVAFEVLCSIYEENKYMNGLCLRRVKRTRAAIVLNRDTPGKENRESEEPSSSQ